MILMGFLLAGMLMLRVSSEHTDMGGLICAGPTWPCSKGNKMIETRKFYLPTYLY